MAHLARVYIVAAYAGDKSSQIPPKAVVLRSQNVHALILRGLFQQDGTRKGIFVAESTIVPATGLLGRTSATNMPILWSKNHGKKGNPCCHSTAYIQNAQSRDLSAERKNAHMGIWEDENCHAAGQIRGLPTDTRQPVLTVCEHWTIVEKNSPELFPGIFMADGQQKGQLRAIGSGSSRSYDIIVECLGSIELHTGSNMAVPGKLLIGGRQLFCTRGRHINPRFAIDPPNLAYNLVKRARIRLIRHA